MRESGLLAVARTRGNHSGRQHSSTVVSSDRGVAAQKFSVAHLLIIPFVLDHLHDLNSVHDFHELFDLLRGHRHAAERTDLQKPE